MTKTLQIEWLGSRLLSFALLSFALCHAIAVTSQMHEIHPFTPVGWEQEQLSISFILFISGIVLASTAWRQPLSAKARLATSSAALNIAVFCILVFLRYFWLSAALFALFSLLYAGLVLCSSSKANGVVQFLAFSACISIFTLFLSFVLGSYLGAGN